MKGKKRGTGASEDQVGCTVRRGFYYEPDEVSLNINDVYTFPKDVAIAFSAEDMVVLNDPIPSPFNEPLPDGQPEPDEPEPDDLDEEDEDDDEFGLDEAPDDDEEPESEEEPEPEQEREPDPEPEPEVPAFPIIDQDGDLYSVTISTEEFFGAADRRKLFEAYGFDLNAPIQRENVGDAVKIIGVKR